MQLERIEHEPAELVKYRSRLWNRLVIELLELMSWQSYQLYDEAYQQHLAAPNTLTLAAYVELHNNYVQDVHAANAMADQFHNVILPQLIQVFNCQHKMLSITRISKKWACFPSANRSISLAIYPLETLKVVP